MSYDFQIEPFCMSCNGRGNRDVVIGGGAEPLEVRRMACPDCIPEIPPEAVQLIESLPVPAKGIPRGFFKVLFGRSASK